MPAQLMHDIEIIFQKHLTFPIGLDWDEIAIDVQTCLQAEIHLRTAYIFNIYFKKMSTFNSFSIPIQ